MIQLVTLVDQIGYLLLAEKISFLFQITYLRSSSSMIDFVQVGIHQKT